MLHVLWCRMRSAPIVLDVALRHPGRESGSPPSPNAAVRLSHRPLAGTHLLQRWFELRDNRPRRSGTYHRQYRLKTTSSASNDDRNTQVHNRREKPVRDPGLHRWEFSNRVCRGFYGERMDNVRLRTTRGRRCRGSSRFLCRRTVTSCPAFAASAIKPSSAPCTSVPSSCGIASTFAINTTESTLLPL